MSLVALRLSHVISFWNIIQAMAPVYALYLCVSPYYEKYHDKRYHVGCGSCTHIAQSLCSVLQMTDLIKKHSNYHRGLSTAFVTCRLIVNCYTISSSKQSIPGLHTANWVWRKALGLEEWRIIGRYIFLLGYKIGSYLYIRISSSIHCVTKDNTFLITGMKYHTYVIVIYRVKWLYCSKLLMKW